MIATRENVEPSSEPSCRYSAYLLSRSSWPAHAIDGPQADRVIVDATRFVFQTFRAWSTTQADGLFGTVIQ